MSVIPMSYRAPRSEETPRTDPDLVVRPSLNRERYSLLVLPKTHHDSPGADVLRRHPTLSDAVYRRFVRNAITREMLFEAGLSHEDQNSINQEIHR